MKRSQLLVILMEEAAEIIQAASKCLRSGEKGDTYGKSNLQYLRDEIGDFLGVLKLLQINPSDLEEKALDKVTKLEFQFKMKGWGRPWTRAMKRRFKTRFKDKTRTLKGTT